LIKTNLDVSFVKPKIRELIDTLFKNVPSGVGATGRLKVSAETLDEVLVKGAKWALENGYATEEDLEHMEENGCMEGADPSKVSERAKARGRPQLGTLGAGNHFLEVQRVDKIFEPEIARAFGIERVDQVVIMLHCGSRGFGHQVATDYLKIHEKASKKYNIWLPDKQLVCAPANSQEGQDYFAAMKCAVNYAFCNRTVMTSWIRESFEKVFGKTWQEMDMRTIYDVAHNICKLEEHIIDGEKRKLYVHRKGATRSLPAGHPLVPKAYREVGQPVLIAGTMGTASYILVGTEKASEAFFSSCHGAGRRMSRTKAIKKFWGSTIQKELEQKGIISRATHPKVLSEEAPLAYKDVDEVVRSVHEAGINRIVARMTPLGVAKG
jgi:tRNA-splicing ligase RtcB